MKKLACALVGLCVATASLPGRAAAPEVKFDVYEFVVEGNTVLPSELVERTVQPFMGPERTFKDIDAAREALEKVYQDAGYLSVVVSVPNQRVDAGEVRLEVTEATVERLNVTGSQYHLPSRIAGQVPSLAKGQIPYFPEVQRQLADVQSADVSVTPIINPGEQPDGIGVDLKVQDTLPVQGSLELNNRQSFNTSKGRMAANLAYGNLFQAGHRIGLGWNYAPWRPNDGNTLSLLYSLPLSARDDLTLSATHSSSNTPIVTGDGGNTVTRGNQYALRWQRSLPARTWPLTHSFYAGLDYKRNADQTSIPFTVNTPKPALRYVVVNTGYSLTWRGDKGTEMGFNTSVATSNRALAGRTVQCDGRQIDQFACKRNGATPDFLAWKLGLDYAQPVWDKWRIKLSASGQLASGPLASGEQITMGGTDTVRGYYDFEQAGDWGWTARTELSTPPLFDLAGWRSLGLFFYDRGFVSIIDAQEGQQVRANLASYGMGWRLENGKGLLLAVDGAQPIYQTRRADSSGTLTVATRRSPHFLASLRQSF